MLVLSRKQGEEIVIDGRIRVTVLNVVGNKVRIGIQAPNNIGIDRKEVFESKLAESLSPDTSQLEYASSDDFVPVRCGDSIVDYRSLLPLM